LLIFLFLFYPASTLANAIPWIYRVARKSKSPKHRIKRIKACRWD